MLRARQKNSSESDAALERLCRTYWPPLYAFIRREGYDAHEAQDPTQEFLSRFVHKEWLNHLQDRRGKFRSFLLTFLKHFLSDERDRSKAQKRGSGQVLVSLEAFLAEERDGLERADGRTPEQIYERRWAQALMNQAVVRLREAYTAEDKLALFEQLKDLQPGEHGQSSYAQIGTALGISEQAVKNAALRFRRRYAQLLRDEIAQTVLDPAEAEEELQSLMNIFSR